MNSQSRRSFFRTLVGTAVAVAAAGRMTFQPELTEVVPRVRFRPEDWCGPFRWIELGAPPLDIQGLGYTVYPNIEVSNTPIT